MVPIHLLYHRPFQERGLPPVGILNDLVEFLEFGQCAEGSLLTLAVCTGQIVLGHTPILGVVLLFGWTLRFVSGLVFQYGVEL